MIYNWGHTSGQGNFTQLNYVGNYLRPGPSTVPQALRFLATESVALPASLYLVGNVLDGFPEISKDNWLGRNSTTRAATTHHFQCCPCAASPRKTPSHEC